jgi:hypothetical protein
MRCSEAGPISTAAKNPGEKLKLALKAAGLLAERVDALPVWVRAPKTGPEYWAGFTRAKLYQLAGEGKIRSVSIREPGKLTGVRLFHLGSILQFIERCEQAAIADMEKEGAK